MNKDPIVEEVRRIRKEIEKQHPDAQSFYDHLERQQRACGRRLVRRQPNRKPQSQAS
jgi:hypothetical protein